MKSLLDNNIESYKDSTIIVAISTEHIKGTVFILFENNTSRIDIFKYLFKNDLKDFFIDHLSDKGLYNIKKNKLYWEENHWLSISVDGKEVSPNLDKEIDNIDDKMIDSFIENCVDSSLSLYSLDIYKLNNIKKAVN